MEILGVREKIIINEKEEGKEEQGEEEGKEK